MLKHRLVFGALFIVGLIGLIYCENWLSRAFTVHDMPVSLVRLGLHDLDGVLVVVVLCFLVVLGTREAHALCVAAGHDPLLGWAVVANVVFILAVFLAANGAAGDEGGRRLADYQHTLIWLTLTILGTAFLAGTRRRTERAIGDIATTLLLILYLGVLPQYIVRLRLSGPDGAAWLLLYFLGTVKVCDIGAYFIGRRFGRHKLIPWLSPGKTIEGLLGGIACSVLLAVLVPMLVQRMAVQSSLAINPWPTPARAAVFGLLMALFGQAGDLLESLFKRDAQAKDSANVIPAFGGVLDILDSPLLAAPVAYWMLIE